MKEVLPVVIIISIIINITIIVILVMMIMIINITIIIINGSTNIVVKVFNFKEIFNPKGERDVSDKNVRQAWQWSAYRCHNHHCNGRNVPMIKPSYYL